MQEIVENILEKIEYENKDKFSALLYKTIEEVRAGDDPYPLYKEILIRLDLLFAGFSPWINTYGKDKRYESGVEVLCLICEELGIEIEKSEAFILFHLRDKGKFKMKEKKLLDELKPIWGQYKHYKLEGPDFSYALKSLMRNKLINYRKGNLQLNQTVLVRIKVEY
ncbi:MAG: hypothetical protein HN576_16240 [Bacteriovoracaceae bacterium]|jgi:hypothetical protein|nr:hypothetical protein [Bacteriovoracaceae bacterium]